jgi:universal stress protein E
VLSRIDALHGDRLSELAGWCGELGVGPETKRLRGRPFVAVIREVLASGHDLVIKAAEGPAEGLRGRLFGSMDQHLLRKCPCPVWLVSPDRDERFRSVLAAVDVEGNRDGELNERVVQLASSLAVREGAALHVVHAWSLYGESILRSLGRGIGPGRLRELLRETKRARARRLRELVSREAVDGSEPALHLLKARPAIGIRHVARRVEADVVVMGTLSRAGATGLLIGNTAEIVLGQLSCAALAIKPAGFRSPLDEAPERAGAAAGS